MKNYESISHGVVVPPELISAAVHGWLEDTTWHNDMSPSFMTRLINGHHVRLWVDSPEANDTYGVPVGSIMIEFVNDEYESVDLYPTIPLSMPVAEALTFVREILVLADA